MVYFDQKMKNTLNITSGDYCGKTLADSAVPGEVFVWHDVLYEGPRKTGGWLDNETMAARAEFLESFTGGGLKKDAILETLKNQYLKLKESSQYDDVILWFDACLFDMAMLVHILSCLKTLVIPDVQLLVVDKFPGINPYNGLGQLNSDQMFSVYETRMPVTSEQYLFAEKVDNAFAEQNMKVMAELTAEKNAPLLWIPAAANRWLQEQPDPDSGMGKLESLALKAIRDGCDSPGTIYSAVAEADSKPQFWGDTFLWAKINQLADRENPLVKISGPTPKLPQWDCSATIKDYRITPIF